MRIVKAALIEDAVARACVRANFILRPDVVAALKAARARETGARSRHILGAIIENAAVARAKSLAVCQDTGMPVVLVEIGAGAAVDGDIRLAVNRGVQRGYRDGYLRDSIVQDPLHRGPSGFGPAVTHIESVPGSRVKITVLPKGFGCENKSQLKMFTPTAPIARVKEFIVSAVRTAGPDACPPYVVGVGIGGTADHASWLAKKALLRKIKTEKVKGESAGKEPGIGMFEREVLDAVNALNVGPMGLGGKTTALAVHVETYPTHIAGMPVAVNISCHALRSASAVL